MKRFFQCFAALCLIAVASTAMAADPVPVLTTADPVLIDTPDIVALSYTLDVTTSGRGDVESNPAGIDCSNDGTTQTGTCSASFPINSVVALMATAPPADDFGSYSFCGWDGDWENSIPVYGFSMDGAKSVTANFCALGPPAYLEPPPTTVEMYGPYLPVDDPVIYTAPEDARPIALVERGDGGYNVVVGLGYYGDGVDGVDVYIGLSIDGVNDFFLINSSGDIVSISGGLVPWKTNTSNLINDETVLEIPGALMPFLPSGVYHAFLMVTPTGSTAFSYTWVTYFENLHFLINPFLLGP